MYRLIAVLLLATVFSFRSYSQTHISGSVADTSQKKSIVNAVIALLTPGDSVLYRFTRTDANGKYSFSNVKEGNYILMTTHPYFADYLDNIEAKGASLNIPPIAVTSKSKLLQEVIVKSGKPIQVRGDTTIYTADSFKVSANANVEELLKKLPGIQVDKTGKITAMGEQVNKVLVDGEEFFGDDPGMAVKNLRADAVKEVQVFDKKSEQAEFTGIDDGKTQKTINLKLKEDKKHGYFGKVDAAGGLMKKIDDRYNTNLMFSSFRGKRKLSAFLLNGNTGQNGINWEDNNKFGLEGDNFSMTMDADGGMMFVSTGGYNSDDEPYVSTENGFFRNINAGIQYTNKWQDKHTLNMSPRYNSQLYDNFQSRYGRTQYGDSVLIDNGTTSTHVNRANLKTSASYNVKLDSNNTVKLSLRANFYRTESEEEKESQSTGNTGTLKNSMNSLNRVNTDKNSFDINLLFTHKFKKARRTLSLNSDWNQLSSDANQFMKALNQAYYNGLPASTQNIDQQRQTEKGTKSFSTRVVYTEPLSKKYSLELAYVLSYNYGSNTQVTHTFSPITQKYDLNVDSLTNDFNQDIWVNRPSVKISYSDKKLKFNFGSGFGLTRFDLRDNTMNKDYKRNYTNFFPSATINYTYKTQHNLRFNYDGSTNQPTINQLQPLRNNNDYFNQYIGNPQLKPSFTNSFNISHNTYNFLKDLYTYQSLNFRFTSNAITNNRVVNLDSGKTVSQPINTNGNYGVNFWGGGGMKIKKLDMRVNFGPNFRYNRTVDVYNSQYNHTNTWSGGINLSLSKSKDKKYDVSIDNDFSYDYSRNSQSASAMHYYTYSFDLDATFYFTKSWFIRSDFSYYIQQKTQQLGSDLTRKLWNARMEKTFKKDAFSAYVSIRDILNENVGISRSFNGNNFSETQNDRLKRYWLVGFTWNFKNKGAAAK